MNENCLCAFRLFWAERKLDKARSWLNRAVHLGPLIGDAWANLYKFEVQHGTEEQQQDVMKRCEAAAPRYGEKWISVTKGRDGWQLSPQQLLMRVAGLV